MAKLLFVSSEPLDEAAAAALDAYRDAPAAVLRLEAHDDSGAVPEGWAGLRAAELVEAERVRQDFLAFLETWPQSVRLSGRPFDEAVSVDGRYSLWWTSVGADRQATHGIYKYFRYAALVDRALARTSPRGVLLLTRDSRVAALIGARARAAGAELTLLRPCPPGGDADAVIDARWLWRAARQAVTASAGRVVAALRVRHQLRAAKLFAPGAGPTVVFGSRFERYLEIRDGQFSPVNWREIDREIRRLDATVASAYLPWKLGDARDLQPGTQEATGPAAVARLHAPLLARERWLPLAGLAGAVRQVWAAWQLYRLARGGGLRAAARFAGTDMSPVVVPELKEAVLRLADWRWRSAQFASALRAAGRVRALVLSEEMYRPSMPLLAAAARLRIPSIGVQHGTLMPSHLMYCLPAGHVRLAPVPDYFAAYGEFARETLGGCGAYPWERIWVTGAARLDPLVTEPADPRRARERLGLPAGRRVVVLATQTFPWFTSAIRAVLEAIREHPEAILCIKKHPSLRAMPIDAIQRLAGEMGVADVKGFTGDIDLLLAACDIWISASSTTILEATLAGKVSICVNFSGEPDSYPYVEDGASLPGRSSEQLTASLGALLVGGRDEGYQQRRAAFLERHAGPTRRGQGAATLARRILEVRPPQVP